LAAKVGNGLVLLCKKNDSIIILRTTFPSAHRLKQRKEDAEMETPGSATPKKPMTKTEIIAALCEATGLAKDQVTGLLDELTKLIEANLKDPGPGTFTIPGLMKINVVRKPATPERKGINPFTKEETIFKAKPAKNVVKVVALKGLKDMV
jgi:nucleoid DNA-binding protein